ncbi:uncharacterized protein JCM10292_007611 [Rhodotorula paludigena]|uniref:uncharacterized protein n=1 Tax=Rhodotorula paludigena TaxID=86838 RepID=UPI0031764BC8
MAQTLEERAAAWQGLCHAQDDFVAALLLQCAGLEEELARPPASLEPGTSISSDRESTKAAEAEQDAIRFEQERKLAELNDESSAYEAIISELRAEAQSRFAQVSQLSEAVSALTVTSAKPPAPALPDTTPLAFTLCLINGNAAPFADGPVSQGYSGGLDVATRLQWEIEKDIKNAMPNVDRHSQEHPLHGGLLVFFFHDEDKSVARLVQRRAVAGVSTWRDFLGGFSSSANNQVFASSKNASLKLVYLIGVRLDQLYSVCPPLSHDACSTKLSRKVVLVNASERDDDDELLQTSGWRVTKFNRFFSTSDLSFAEPDKPRSPSTSLSAAVSTASSPIALAKKYIPGDRPVAASDGEDLTALYASLTTKTSKHKFDPAKRLLQQDPQICVWHYFSSTGCTMGRGCDRSHRYNLTQKGRDVLGAEVATIRCKELLHTGHCSWQREKGSRCLFSQ